jgi:hypothetical protein
MKRIVAFCLSLGFVGSPLAILAGIKPVETPPSTR